MATVTPFIRAAKSDEGIELWLTGEIGAEVRFIDLQNVFQYHAKSGEGDMTLNIYSHGGYLDDATAFYDWIADTGMKFKVRIWGTAMSAATVIAAAAGRENIEIAANATWMIHETSGGTDEMRKHGNDALVRVYRKLTGKKEKEIRDMIAATTTLSATEAVQHGFAGKVMKSTARLAAMYEATPIETTETMENTNTAKVALNVKLNLAQALKSMTGEGTELEVTVDDAVAAQLTSKDEEINALKLQIATLEEAKAAEGELITKEAHEAVTAQVAELDGKITAKLDEVKAKDAEIAKLTAELADLKRPLAEPIVPNNKEVEPVIGTATEDSDGAKIIKAAIKQANPLQLAQAKMQQPLK